MTSRQPTLLARSLRDFFAEHMPLTRGLSPHTVRSYRDAFALLLRFLASTSKREVVDLEIDDLVPDAIIAFLADLESRRSNCASTRNARLAAVHAFARFVAAKHPEHLVTCQRLLLVPFKRARSRSVEYLEEEEFRAMLDAVDQSSDDGPRDRALLLFMFDTGARVQEVLDLRPCDLQLIRPLQARLLGKGRKERLCPLRPTCAAALKTLMAETRLDAASTSPLFRNRRGDALTRFGVRYLLRKYAVLAQVVVPSLARKRVHPHTMRHTAAVHLLHSGVDMPSISHWLGHASLETTNRYTVVDLDSKRAALAKVGPVGDIDPALKGWKSDASILDWLESL